MTSSEIEGELGKITMMLTRIENKQKEQDEKIKQLEEKVKLASIGFPVSLFT